MFSQQLNLDEKLLDHASILDNKFKIIETIGEGRYAKLHFYFIFLFVLNKLINEFDFVVVLLHINSI
jgi:hypothetical protein